VPDQTDFDWSEIHLFIDAKLASNINPHNLVGSRPNEFSGKNMLSHSRRFQTTRRNIFSVRAVVVVITMSGFESFYWYLKRIS